MNKKFSYVILAIVVIFIVGLILVLQRGEQKGAPTGESQTNLPPVSEESVSQTAAEADEIVRKAIDAHDVSLCAKIIQEGYRKSCREYAITAAASVNGDPTICDQLTEEGQRISCKDYLIINQAVAAQNPSLCEKMINKTRVEECKEAVPSPK